MATITTVPLVRAPTVMGMALVLVHLAGMPLVASVLRAGEYLQVTLPVSSPRSTMPTAALRPANTLPSVPPSACLCRAISTMALSTIKVPKATGGVVRVMMPPILPILTPICTAYTRIPPISALAATAIAASGTLLGVFSAPSAGLGFPAIPMSVA